MNCACTVAETQIGAQVVFVPISIRLTIIVIQEARDQLEERVRIIDGVLNLGYRKTVMFSREQIIIQIDGINIPQKFYRWEL